MDPSEIGRQFSIAPTTVQREASRTYIVRELLPAISFGLMIVTAANAQSLFSPEPILKGDPNSPNRSFTQTRRATAGPSLITSDKACDLPGITAEGRTECLDEQKKYIEFSLEHWSRLSPQLQSECNELANRDYFGEHNEILARCIEKHETR